MTDGSRHPNEDPEITPSPWSDESDDDLAPPFVPGGEAARPREPEPDVAPAGPGSPEPVEEAAKPEPGAETPDPEAAPGVGEAEESFPFEGDWTQGDDGPALDVEAEDDFPFDAFDIEGGEGEPGGTGAETAAGPGEAGVPQSRAGGADVEAAASDLEGGRDEAGALAGHLETMARRLREKGVEAVEADMASPDRFTALLAGLLAGYLAGRR